MKKGHEKINKVNLCQPAKSMIWSWDRENSIKNKLKKLWIST